MLGRLGIARRGFMSCIVHKGPPYPYSLVRDRSPKAQPASSGGSAMAAIRFAGASPDSRNESIIGWIAQDADDAQLGPRQFVENRAFWPVVLDVLEKHAHEDPELQAQAAFQKTGWMNIADGRNPPPLGRTGSAEDIIGCVRVDDKEIQAGSFQANLAHRPVTADGLFQLPRFLQARLVDRLSSA
ncbi:hypothetical protein GGF46_004003 [Coemansia sp. RSA 552]|nr:hypothetical protein GGF46_004003 [Coemansia sp. RSA 552]